MVGLDGFLTEGLRDHLDELQIPWSLSCQSLVELHAVRGRIEKHPEVVSFGVVERVRGDMLDACYRAVGLALDDHEELTSDLSPES